MRILMLTENDPAGSAILFKSAINKYTEHTCRLITTKEKYNFDFEKDIHIPALEHDPPKEFKKYGKTSLPIFYCDYINVLLKDADIFHFHILSDESMEIGPFKVKDYIKGKGVVHHHHGHPDFRGNPNKHRLKYKKLKRKVLVSTPDLLMGLPEAYWMPNLVPLDDPLYMPTEERYEEFTVGHSPTRLALKNTAEFIEAANKIGISVDIIMNTPHAECLRRKQKCHVIFDHLQGYYGMSSLEGLSMNKWVVANLHQVVQNHIREFVETEDLPWLNIYDFGMNWWIKNVLYVLRHKEDPLSREFMEKHWYPKRVVDRLIKFYETL